MCVLKLRGFKMIDEPKANAAIVDYGLGNLFSVKLACEKVGMTAIITSDKNVIRRADVVILPGVGAYRDAMVELELRGLTDTLHRVVESGKMLVGICLGMQLLMEESFEFGHHQGLGIIKGSVVRFEHPRSSDGRILKVPQVGWNKILKPKKSEKNDPWQATPLQEIKEGSYVYFVHSFYCLPTEVNVSLAITHYGHIQFCSSLQNKNIFAIQFHPERSGPAGLNIYRNIMQQCLR
jgi:glutamine amidotransferase